MITYSIGYHFFLCLFFTNLKRTIYAITLTSTIMTYLYSLLLLLIPITQGSSYHISTLNTSKVLVEVVNHDSKNLNGLELEIHTKERLIARLNTNNITAISLPKEKYQFILYYCDEIYTITAEVEQQQHHMVFIVGEKKCQETPLFSK